MAVLPAVELDSMWAARVGRFRRAGGPALSENPDVPPDERGEGRDVEEGGWSSLGCHPLRPGDDPPWQAAPASGRYPGARSPEVCPTASSPRKPRPGSAGFADGSFEVGVQDGLQCRHVLHDRAPALQGTRRPIDPARIGGEHEECIPDELTGRPVGVGEGMADALLVVPEMGRAQVDEQVGHWESGVERHHGEPDDVHTDIGFGVLLEDLRLHLTGTALTDASGR